MAHGCSGQAFAVTEYVCEGPRPGLKHPPRVRARACFSTCLQPIVGGEDDVQSFAWYLP